MHCHKCILFALLIPFVVAADDNPQALLERVRAKVTADAVKIPRYICRQSIERKTLLPASRKPSGCTAIVEERQQNPQSRPASVDQAKLDVILSDAGEMFSWPGKHRFDAQSPGDLLVGGMSGSGDFAGFRLDTFTLESVTIRYEGKCDGPFCARFRYEVPREVSRYVLRAGKGEFRSGYHGTFDVDTRTAELLRFDVAPMDVQSILPEACLVETQITYSRAASDHGDFMIPSITDKELIRDDGMYFRNQVSYEGCRQYGAESTIKFDADSPPSSSDSKAQARPPSPGSDLEIKLVSKIDSQTGIAGVRSRGS